MFFGYNIYVLDQIYFVIYNKYIGVIKMKLNIVLVEPEIPQNTGNIARTCAAIGAKLHLVHPLGFDISEKQVKRAGLDYWDKLDIEEHDNLDKFLEKYDIDKKDMYLVSTKATHVYSDVDYGDKEEIFLLFGKETKGLPEGLLKANLDKTIRIPMGYNIRSLNLSNSVAIVAYEVMKQCDFDGLQETSEYLL